MGAEYEVSVVPNSEGWSAKLEAQIGAPMRQLAEDMKRRLGEAGDAFNDFGARLLANLDPASRAAAEALKRRLQEGVRDGLNGTGADPRARGTRLGTDYGDSFSRALRTRMEAAVRNLPEIKLNANSTAVDREIAEIRARMQRLLTDDTYRIELGINDREVLAHVEEMRAQLERLSRLSPDIRVRVNTGAALAELEALKRGVNDLDGRQSRIRRLFSGDAFGDLFRSVVTSLRNASPLLDATIGKLGSLAGQVKGVGDEATAGFKDNPVVGLIISGGLTQALIALASTIGPIVAGATAGVIGLAGGAATALVAFKGIRDQMEAGVGYGAKLKTAFSGVMDTVSQIGARVADAIGPGLLTAVDNIKRALPSFSGLFQVVGRQLGGIANSGSQVLVNVFRAAQPLIVQVVAMLQTGARRLAEWTASPGFQKFLDYAAAMLPKVVNLVGSIGKALIDGFVAFAPIGETVINFLTGVAQGAGAVFRFLGGIAQGIAGIFGADFDSQASKQSSTFADLTAQLKALTTGYDTTSSASTGMAAVFGVTNDAYAAATKSISSTADQLAATTLQMQLQDDAAGLLKQSLDALSGKNLGVAQSLSTFQQGLLGIDDTFTKAAFSSTAFTDTAVAQRAELQQLVTAAQAHAQAIGQQTGSTQAATAALADDYAQILANTGATGANRDAIAAYIQQVGAIPAVAPTRIDVNTATATAMVNQFKGVYGSLVDKTVFVNANTDSATVAINRFVQTPRTAYVQVQTLGPTGTSGGRAVYAYGGIAEASHYAMGGMIDGLSAKLRAASRFAGGTELHIPQIAMPNGGVRIWAEPETQGEAYIPLANDSRRARAEGILSDVATRFGLTVMRPVAAPSVAGGGDVVAALGRVEARIGAVEAAVYAGASHVGDRYDGAVQQAAVVAGQRAQSGPRSQAS